MGVGWQCLRWVCFPSSGFLVGYFSSIYQLNKIKEREMRVSIATSKNYMLNCFFISSFFFAEEKLCGFSVRI